MRLFFRLAAMFLLCCIPNTAVGKIHTPYNGSRIFWDAQNPVVIFHGAGYARLIQLQNGQLMACAESGGIKVAYSHDQGRTWTDPCVIAPNPSKWPNCVPDLIQLQDGTIIVAYNPRAESPYSPDRPFSIRLRHSTDEGATWSNEIVVYDGGYTFDDGCWEPSLLQLPTGELQLYFADESPYTTNANQQISLCRSFDGGLTWSKPQKISYRRGSRDGMPVPVLLKDKSSIVVAIEDNGWSGVGDFIPTTVRCSYASNWKNNRYVSSTSKARLKAVDYNYCPMAKGGAPYLRVLPNGETILSHQSPYGEGDNIKMYCYVGDKQAKHFKAMSCPFLFDSSKQALWNSLTVIDTGVVAAVGGISGNVTMLKGYPKQQFEAHDSTFPMGRQVMMGNETGTYTYADFAYNHDSLYLYVQVYDSTSVKEDKVSFSIESTGASTDVPLASTYRWDCYPSGGVEVFNGNGATWERSNATCKIQTARTNAYYQLQLSIAWRQMRLPSYPQGIMPRVNLEITNVNGDSQVVERIPDTNPDAPWTWMPLHGQP